MLKPAEDTPASATLLGRLAIEAGIPPGVLNVVHGYGRDSAGQALPEHRDIDRVTFTGESGTGRIVAAAGARNLVPASLELGGKGANLVFADADLDTAVEWSIKAIFTNTGQVCLAGSWLYVQRDIVEEFVPRFAAAADSMANGDPKDEGTQVGTLASGEGGNFSREFFTEPKAVVMQIKARGVNPVLAASSRNTSIDPWERWTHP